ncbi:MAG: WYL domain-containing protein, partial [Bacteroidota bacterium]|nr:WYL domain-containing protein [Bacteroidota bacterium]
MANNLFRRYIWLIDTVNSYGPITYEEISAKWERCSFSGGNKLPLRTLHNHREAIAENFGIDIVCN